MAEYRALDSSVTFNKSGDRLPPIDEVALGHTSNLMLLCESPTQFSPMRHDAHKQEQNHAVKFTGTFQGVRRLPEPKPGKLAPLSNYLARSRRPSKTNPWQKPPLKKKESVIRRMHEGEVQQLQPAPKRRAVIERSSSVIPQSMQSPAPLPQFRSRTSMDSDKGRELRSVKSVVFDEGVFCSDASQQGFDLQPNLFGGLVRMEDSPESTPSEQPLTPEQLLTDSPPPPPTFMMDQLSPEASRLEMDFFEAVVAERKAIEEFLQARPKTIPNMVIKQFRHHLNDQSELVEKIRHEVPLKTVERIVKDVGTKALTFTTFNQLLVRMMGEGSFSRVDAQSLFCYFDSDGDGDVDLKELYNGFILVLSDDGPLISVLHRVKSMLRPSTIRDTRLNCMSRFELVLMVDAIKAAAALSPPKMKKLEAELQSMLSDFGCDKRGQFPFDRVRKYLLESNSICEAVDSFTVPREKELYESFLSQFYRTTDAEEGEQSFKLMKTEKTDRRLKQETQPQPVVAKKNTSSTHSRTPSGTPQQSPGAPDPSASPSAFSLGGGSSFPPPTERPVVEPGQPTFFTLKGVLYRQLDGEEPQPYWVPGMAEQRVKYTGDEKRRATMYSE